MKHFFCYTEDMGELSPTSKVFKVLVGDSKRDQINKTRLDILSVKKGAFFRIWDADTEVLLNQRQHAFSGMPKDCPFAFQIVRISISDLYKAVLDGRVSSIDNSDLYYRARFREQKILDPHFFLNAYFRLNSQTALTSKKLNLSDASRNEAIKAAVNFGLILVLFLLGSILEGMEHLFY